MAKQYTKAEVAKRLKDTIASGKPVVIAGAGTGISGKFAERGGVDLVGVYNSGLYRMDGNGSLAGLMPYGNANQIVIDLAHRVFPQIKEAPMIAGICGSDPTREMRPYLKQLKDLGFSAVMNLTVGLMMVIIKIKRYRYGLWSRDRRLKMAAGWICLLLVMLSTKEARMVGGWPDVLILYRLTQEAIGLNIREIS